MSVLLNGVDVANSLDVGIHAAHEVIMSIARIMLLLSMFMSALMKMRTR